MLTSKNFPGEQRRKRGERKVRVARGRRSAKSQFFRAPPLARDSRFSLASLSPLFAKNTQIITPVLQASWKVGLSKQSNSYQSTLTCLCFRSPPVQLASQHVWFCTMWPDRAKGLLKEGLVLPAFPRSFSALSFIRRKVVGPKYDVSRKTPLNC